MHDSCAFHAGLESPVKMISMRRIWAQRPNLVSNSRPDPIIGASRMGMLLVRLAIARSPSCVRQDPFSRPTNWQFFGNARSRKCLPLIRPMMRPPGRIGIFSSQRAQGQATQGRDVSTLAPLRVLRTRAPVPACHPILRSKCDASGQPHPAASVGLRRARTHVLHCTSRSYSAETSRPV
jgi:hypothetical protein